MKVSKSSDINHPKFTFNPIPKPNHPRRTPNRGERGKFNPDVRQEIIERDKGLCIRCRRPAIHIHHITYRSQLGTGTKRNGVCLCYQCHEMAHSNKTEREWLERWRDFNLDRNGNLKEGRD